MSNTSNTPAARRDGKKHATDASVCVNEPGGLPTDSARAEGRLTGRRCPGRGRGRPRAPPGVARGCWTPRAVARAEVARVRGRCATPRSLAKRRERRGRTLHFSHFARGGLARGAVPRPRSLVDFESRRTLLFPRLRRARSLWPGALPSRRRVRSPYRDRRRETTHARASFPRVRSDSLPAGQPSRVRGVPACLLAKRSTRLSASLLASARSPCAVVLCGVRAFRGDAKSVGQRKRSLCATVTES